MGDPSIYEAAGGRDVMLRIAAAWHDRAIECFAGALHDAGVAANLEIYDAMLSYWGWATWYPMYAYHESPAEVPAKLPMPQWDWAQTVTFRESQ
ncbi:hypothetical protein HJ588_16170 [Flexivirga sp. ID2601S]|uniref:Uncharacterized protein n=1 Tax=Flexivirga aerilata TaxID=1656889 RepID=A0A849AKA8_9MICO|nr:hypothetical protein [Flexivirga aerilata]NNG40799.1 hypothetical protein [Flexivirga aerilata]